MATISSEERASLLEHLQGSRRRFLHVLEGLSDAQWTFRPTPEGWSIAHCAEHIASGELAVMAKVRQALAAPMAPQRPAEAVVSDEYLRDRIPLRNRKASAPPEMQPSELPAIRDLVRAFSGARDETIRYVESTQDNLRRHFAAHFALKALDAYQWLLLASAHTERHANQIEEIKQHPDWPR